MDLLPFWLSLIVLGACLFLLWRKGILPPWAAGLAAAVAAVAALLVRRPPAAPPRDPPPAPPDREVANTAASIVREQGDRDREVIADAGTDVDKLADIGRGQR